MRNLMVFAGGLIFGIGLALSQMARPEVVLSFLQLRDMGLLLVLGGAVVVTAITFALWPRVKDKPMHGTEYKAMREDFDKKTVLGAVVFGAGWGISGLCPGAAVASVGIGNYPALFGIAGIFIGAYLHGRFIG